MTRRTVFLTTTPPIDFRLRPIAMALCLSITPAISAPVFAQEGREKDNIASSAKIHHFNIPAQPLNEALIILGQQSGLQVTTASDLVAGKQASAVIGTMTTPQALTQLLSGTNLDYRVDGPMVSLHASGNSPVLPAVKIRASTFQESALGPVEGYVAKRSFSGTKVDLPLIETAQSVSVVTRDQISIQNAESLVQTFKYVAGVQPMGTDHTTNDGLIIRGFNATGTGPMFLNGTKLSRATYSGVSEPYAMERIEVLKGPASVLYGNAAPGGIINMVSKQPQLDPLRELEIQMGNFERKQIAGDFTGPLTREGEFAYRLTGLARSSDTMINYIPDDRDFAAASILWQPSEDTSLTLFANYQNNETSYLYGLPASGTVLDNPNGKIPRNRFVGEPDFNKFDVQNHTLGYLFSHKYTEHLTFRQNFLYGDAETDYNDIYIGALDASGRLLSRGAYSRLDKDKNLTIDNQLEGRWQTGSVTHTALVGLDYAEVEFDRLQYFGTVAALDIFTPQYGSVVALDYEAPSGFKEETKQLGLYAQEHIKIANDWVIMLGGRYDKFEAEEDSEQLYDDNALSGRIGLVYLLDNGIAPYLSYSESFQPSTGRDVSGETFEPTEGDQLEFGFRYQPNQQQFLLSAAIYQLRQKNVLTPDLNNAGFSVQEGELESAGVELELRANLTNNLNFVASYAYIDNEITKSNNNTLGRRFANVPRNAASAWLDYLFGGALAGFKLGGGVRYQEETDNLANTYKVPSFTVVDAMASYELFSNWQLSLNIKNVFDKEYATCTYACFYGVERSGVMSVKYHW